MLRIGQVERDVLAAPVHECGAYAGDLVVGRELERDRIAGARAARDGIGDLLAELERDAALVVGRVRDRPLSASARFASTNISAAMYEPSRSCA